HPLRYRIPLQYFGLSFPIGTDVVRQVTPGPQHDFNRISESRSGKGICHYVVPHRTSTRKQYWIPLETLLCRKCPRDLNGPLQKFTNRKFVVEDALVHLDTAQHDRIAPASERCKHRPQLFVVAHPGSSARHTQFEKDSEPLTAL